MRMPGIGSTPSGAKNPEFITHSAYTACTSATPSGTRKYSTVCVLSDPKIMLRSQPSEESRW